MTEMSAGLRAMEMRERQTFYQDRARRERTGTAVDRPRRRLFRTRVARPGA